MPASRKPAVTADQWAAMHEARARQRLANKHIIDNADMPGVRDEFLSVRDRAFAAGMAGAIPELGQFGLDILSHIFVAQKVDVPFTVDEMRDKFGVPEGEDMGASFLGELVGDPGSGMLKMGILPVKAMRKTMPHMTKVWDAAEAMFKNAEDPRQIYRATGVFKGASGELLFHRQNPGRVNLTRVRELVEERLPNLGHQETSKIWVRPRDILDGDDELFKMFPWLDDVNLHVHVKNTGTVDNKKLQIFNNREGRQKRGTAYPEIGRIELFNAEDAFNASTTLYHEIFHVVDSVQQILPTGGTLNRAKYYEAYDAYLQNKVFLIMAKNIEDGVLDLTDPESVAKQMNDLQVFDINQRAAHGAMVEAKAFWRTFKGDPNDMELNYIKTQAQAQVDKYGTTLSVLGKEAAQEVGLDELDSFLLDDMIHNRYYNLEGEFRQRLDQYLMGKDEQEVNQILEAFAGGEVPQGMKNPVPIEEQVVEEVRPAFPEHFEFEGPR